MQKLINILSNVLGVDKENINEETKSQDIETWDSFNGLMLISELEAGFGVKFSIDEVVSMNSFKAIVEVLRKHGVEID